MRLFILFTVFCFNSIVLFGQDIIIINSESVSKIGVGQVQILIDSSGNQNVNNIIYSPRFRSYSKGVGTLSKSKNNIWIKFSLQNRSKEDKFYFTIDYANISEIFFYKRQQNNLKLIAKTGNAYPFHTRPDENINFNFEIDVPAGLTGEYYAHVNSAHPLQLPLFIDTIENKSRFNTNQLLIIGIYAGLIISILLYNLFLFFATKDKSYLYYVLYLATLLFAQLTLLGWSFKIFWPQTPSLNTYAVVFTTSLTSIMALIFAFAFLHIKKYSKILALLFYFLIVCYVFAFTSTFFTNLSLSYNVLTYNGIFAGILLLTASAYVAIKGYRPAYYYFLAWFIFALAREIFSLRNLNILPYNNFTTYILYIGSAIEAILLSFALADRINNLRKEKDESQAYSLKVLRENERLIREQNIVLEQKVTERTNELQNTNKQLNKTLANLKDAEIQLVEAEKMASLGQLTAGIAHEINNPINFVKANIKPLRLDIDELFDIINQYNQLHDIEKDKLEQHLESVNEKLQAFDIDYVKIEIQQLIKGIEDGAERTAEIVKGLRTFSRLDESELNIANVHEGIESTLVLLRNSVPSYIKIEKSFCANGNIECFAGKLNQVFMNILNNAIQAIIEKPKNNADEKVTITTSDTPDKKIQIFIKDTGIGMNEDTKHRIFEPFFTTKPVGEGTGLGMAIVFKIIEEHFGKIDILSEPGMGTEFIITLPHIYSSS